jgi:hypothetical protein
VRLPTRPTAIPDPIWDGGFHLAQSVNNPFTPDGLYEPAD